MASIGRSRLQSKRVRNANKRTRGEDCCCDEPVIPCAGGTFALGFNPADHSVSVKFSGGVYDEFVCDFDCRNEFETPTYNLTWVPEEFRWRYYDPDWFVYNAPCPGPPTHFDMYRYLDIGLGVSCIPVNGVGKLVISPKAFWHSPFEIARWPNGQAGNDGVFDSAAMALNGRNSNGAICFMLKPLRYIFPEAEINLGTWIDMGQVFRYEERGFPVRHCNCYFISPPTSCQFMIN